jgi:beta-carotene hydroxylase
VHRASELLPSISALGRDLVLTTPRRRAATVAIPFVLVAFYFAAALRGHWFVGAAIALALAYGTYGSVSHDLVHHALGLPPRLDDVLLSVLEVVVLRSGTAYRITHLQHHRQLVFDDDQEGRPARQPLWRVLVESPIYIPRLWKWAWHQASKRERRRIAVETALVVLILVAAVASFSRAPALLVYAGLVTVATWGFPIVFVVLQHDAHVSGELGRTRRYRGRVLPALTLQHLFHLEHHLYPMVPAHHWKELARRLDPHLDRAGVRAIAIP